LKQDAFSKNHPVPGGYIKKKKFCWIKTEEASKQLWMTIIIELSFPYYLKIVCDITE
jgi:hypothetical protein